MKLVCIFIFCLGYFFQSKSQSNKFLTISGNVGANIGMNIVGLQKTGITAYPLLDAPVIMSNFPIELNVGLLKPLSVGVNYAPSSWRIGAVKGNFTSLGLNANLYIVNNNRFNMQLSLTPSLLHFQTFTFVYNHNNKLSIDLNGNAFKTRLMFNFYLSDYAGIYFNLGYSRYNIGIKKYDLLLQDADLETQIKSITDQDFNLVMPGVQIGIGVVFKIVSLPSKK